MIALLGGTPVFVDIDSKTFNMDPDKLDQAIRGVFAEEGASIPRAVVTVDLFGLPCDYDRINAVAREHGLFVIEDAAQGLGGEYKGRKACSLAEVGCTSFFPAKPLAFAYLGYREGDFPVSEACSRRIFSLPMHPYLGEKEQERTCNVMRG